MSRQTRYTFMESPVGRLLLVEDARGLVEIRFQDGAAPQSVEPHWRKVESLEGNAVEQLQEYFAGTRRHFNLPLAFEGTEFQREVWRALCDIPYGETITYGELARRIGRPKAVRAVGAANGKNPLPIVAPCHRVIGSDGSLTGYGGGLEIKRVLLDLEKSAAPTLFAVGFGRP